MRALDRRMMDQHDAERLLALELREHLAEPRELIAVQRPVAASGGVGSDVDSPISASGPRRRTKGKLLAAVAAHVVAPVACREAGGRAHIGVVIAGHDGDVARAAERCEPGARRREFVGQRQVDEIAGDRDVVGRLRLEVGDQRAPACRRGGSGGACAAS